jgi:hypothetical protein
MIKTKKIRSNKTLNQKVNKQAGRNAGRLNRQNPLDFAQRKF